MTVTCDNCEKTFYSKSNLTRHQRSTCFQDSPIFTCKFCLNDFTYKSNLIRHQKSCKIGIVTDTYCRESEID